MYVCWLLASLKPDILDESRPVPDPRRALALCFRLSQDMLYMYAAIRLGIKPDSHIAQPLRLLDQVREVLRYKHYSVRTEQAYLYRIGLLVRWKADPSRCAIRATWARRRSAPS